MNCPLCKKKLAAPPKESVASNRADASSRRYCCNNADCAGFRRAVVEILPNDPRKAERTLSNDRSN